MSDRIESSVGHVTARIGAHQLGEVRIPYGGGNEVFHARCWDETQEIEVGTEIVVIERTGPRTVKVSPLYEEKR